MRRKLCGLFLGDAATAAATDLSGTFPDTQDQRNTLRGRLRYQVSHRLWLAGGLQYGSGLPFEFACPGGKNLDACVQGVFAQYGQQIVNRIDFSRGRIRPTFLLDASAGAELYKSYRADVQLQIDGENLNDVLDVIDFGGLFSANAIGPSHSVFLRLTTTF